MKLSPEDLEDDFIEYDRSTVIVDPDYFANTFVVQYYHKLRQTPDTAKEIGAKIQSLNLKTLEIETVTSQHSHNAGVIFVATGVMSKADEVRRKFAQTFFLAPIHAGFDCTNIVVPLVFEPETEFGDLSDKKESEMVKEINGYLNHIGQDDSMTVNSSDSSSSGAKEEKITYASIVMGPKAAAGGASYSRWTPETSKRILGSTNLSAEPTASHPTNAQDIAANFLKQYYHALCKTPELANQFYDEMSVLSWPNSDGKMTTVTTLKEIDVKIRTLNFTNSMPKIETVVVQNSHDSGIIVVVTGAINGTDDVRKEFSQTFFLAPGELPRYFVRNDIAVLTSTSVVPSGTLQVENTEESKMVKEIVNEQSKYIGQDGSMTVNNSDSSGATKEMGSYASIVKAPKPAASGVSNLRGTATKTGIRKLGSTNLSAEPMSSPLTSDIHSSNPRKVEGHSVYIRNLPLNTNVAEVTKDFRKFGPINDGSVQVKIHKDYGYCYGFVEFQSLDSMENAIKESPLKIGGHNVVVEKKKSTIRAGSGHTERFTSERGKFQNDGFRGRGYFGRGGNDSFKERGYLGQK
ncbi:hypothetical protein POM88_035115 [Heracleum sosnowskyi]|uniref:Uncharacterized protein n=1 Tax=Heracleum sosnowskyi TaxID=360622 RepID=A0AAD8HLJ0_9APIA|nr:hypothetical protein POM88_035115 [Heracleum sosnowskyi]